MTTWTPQRLSALHQAHLDLGATIVESAGWQRPARYTSAEDEVDHLSRVVGLADISPVGKLLLQGANVGLAAGRLLRPLDLPVPGAVLDHRSNGLSLTVARLAEDEVMFLTSPSQVAEVLEGIRQDATGCAHVVDLTSGLTGIRVTGPASPLLLAGLTEMDVAPGAFVDRTCAQSKFVEVYGLLLRMDISGLLSYDLFVGREFGGYVWESLMEAGREFSVAPYGLEAMDRLA